MSPLEKCEKVKLKAYCLPLSLQKFSNIVTIDSDLENSLELIPEIVCKVMDFDFVVVPEGSFHVYPRKIASKTLGKMFVISDFYSNFRAFKKDALVSKLVGGETFGGELLVTAKKRGCRRGGVKYDAPHRRNRPRIDGKFMANLRILVASWKCFFIYFVSE